MNADFGFADWAILGAYAALSFAVGWWVRSRVASMRDFSVAGGRISTAAVFAAMAATFIGPGYTIGFAGQGYKVGLIVSAMFVMFALKTGFEGVVLAPRMRRYPGAATVGDIIGAHFGATAKAITGALSVLYCAGIAAVVSRAAGVTLETFTGIPMLWGGLLTTLLVLGYTYLGGMWASVRTDMFQFLFLGLVIPLIPVALILGWAVTPVQHAAIEVQLSGNMMGSMPTGALLIGMLSFFFGEFLLPPYTQRIFIGRTSKITQTAFFFACILFVAWVVITVSTGVLMRAILPNEPTPDAVLLKAINQVIPSGIGLKGLVCAAIAAVIMSTQDSFVLSAGTCYVHDVHKLYRRNASDRELLFAARLAMVGAGLLGWLFSITLPSLIEGLLYLYTFWSPTVVLPLILAILGIPSHRMSGLLAIIVGGLVTALWELGALSASGIPSIVAGLIANQLAYWLPVVLYGSAPSKLSPARSRSPLSDGSPSIHKVGESNV